MGLSYLPVSTDECIEWDGALNVNGYGRVSRTVSGRKKKFYIHRLVWEENHGRIPEGLVVMHKCDNRPCINIDHLMLGTQTDNKQDASKKGRYLRTHCKNGHAFTGSNIRISERTTRKHERVCRECSRTYAREYYHQVRKSQLEKAA